MVHKIQEITSGNHLIGSDPLVIMRPDDNDE